mgnify:CR=1 FL=1
MMAKYRNKKVTVGDLTFDSQKEYGRWRELCLLERAGAITDLERQVVFELIPAQRLPSGEVYKKCDKKGQPKPGKVIEKEVNYVADFTYREGGDLVVEDSKGKRTKDYIIKRKLMLWVHGIRIKET